MSWRLKGQEPETIHTQKTNYKHHTPSRVVEHIGIETCRKIKDNVIGTILLQAQHLGQSKNQLKETN